MEKMLDIFAFGSCKLLIISTIFCLILILYWYLTRNYNYWTEQGISGPKPIIFFGTFLDRAKDNLGPLDVQYVKKYGKVYGLFDGTSPVLQIADPELIKLVLVKEFHLFTNRRELRSEHPVINNLIFFARFDNWRRIRTIMGSTFTNAKVKRLYALVRTCVQDYLDYLEKVAQSNQPLNAKEMHENYTMDVIATCAFATKTNSTQDPNNSFLVNLRKSLEMKASRVIPAFIFPKFLNKLLNLTSYLNPEATDKIINLLKLLIKKRRQSGEKNNDFLQLLIDAKADDSKKGDLTDGLESHYVYKESEDTRERKTRFTDESLTEDEIVAQSFVFLFAASETSATTLGYMSREMALNPEVQQKLYNELVGAMGSDKEIDFDHLQQLPYLDACLSETLRLYPPITRVEREVSQDYKLGYSQIRLYKGQLVEIPVYAMHHSEEHFKNAEQFIPERFLRENRKDILPYTYMPFGTGPRNCIGMRFGLMEMKLAMTHIITRFRFTKCDKTEEKIQFKPFTPLLTPYSNTLGIEAR